MATITSLNMPPTPAARPGAGMDGDRPPRTGAPAVADAARMAAAAAAAAATAATTPGDRVSARDPLERQIDASGRPTAAGDAALEQAIVALNEQAGSLNRSLRFMVDKDTGRTVIKVVDRETDEVIRQIPPEYTMEILRRLDIGAGVLLEERA